MYLLNQELKAKSGSTLGYDSKTSILNFYAFCFAGV